MNNRFFLTVLILLINISIFSTDNNIFNYTFVPYVNLIEDNENPTMIATGFLTSNLNSINGFQFAPIFSTSSTNLNGVQASGLFNLVGEDTVGVQTAGIFNHSKNMKGLQLAGVFNTAENVKGGQIAVTNVATDLDGFQLGIVNIANGNTDDGIGLGLVNIYKDGIKNVITWVDSQSNISMGFESGNKNLYTQIYTGSSKNNILNGDDRYFGIGLGFRPIDFLDIVVGGKNYLSGGESVPTAKVSLSLDIKHISLTAGIESDISIGGYNEDSELFNDLSSVNISNDIDLYYQFFVGIKYHL